MATDAAFRAIADGTRREILTALRARPMAVHEIAARFPMSRPAISKHLRVLSEAGLVEAKRAAQQNVYALRAEPLEGLAAWLGDFWSARLRLLERVAKGDS